MSITPEEIQRLITDEIDGSEVDVQGGEGKYMVRVVSDVFAGMNAVKRQQTVYRILNPHISSGAIHAVSMDLVTPEESSQRE